MALAINTVDGRSLSNEARHDTRCQIKFSRLLNNIHQLSQKPHIDYVAMWQSNETNWIIKSELVHLLKRIKL